MDFEKLAKILREQGAFTADVGRQDMDNQRNQGGQGMTNGAAASGAVLGGDRPHFMDKANETIERYVAAGAEPYIEGAKALGKAGKRLIRRAIPTIAAATSDLPENLNKLGTTVSSGIDKLGSAVSSGLESIDRRFTPEGGNAPVGIGSTGPRFAPSPTETPAPLRGAPISIGKGGPVFGTEYNDPMSDQDYLDLKPATPAAVTPGGTAAPVTPADRPAVQTPAEVIAEIREDAPTTEATLPTRYQSPGDQNIPQGGFNASGAPLVGPRVSERNLYREGSITGDRTSVRGSPNFTGNITPATEGIMNMAQEYEDRVAAQKAAAARGRVAQDNSFSNSMKARKAGMDARTDAFLRKRDAKNAMASVKRKDRAGLYKQMMSNAQSERESIRDAQSKNIDFGIAADRNQVARERQATDLDIARRRFASEAASDAATNDYRLQQLGQTAHKNAMDAAFKQQELQGKDLDRGIDEFEALTNFQRKQDQTELGQQTLNATERQRLIDNQIKVYKHLTGPEGMTMQPMQKLQMAIRAGFSEEQTKALFTPKEWIKMGMDTGTE